MPLVHVNAALIKELITSVTSQACLARKGDFMAGKAIIMVLILHICMQRDANSGWSSLYPSFWSGFFAKPSPTLEMTVDTDRNILYTRSENSFLQVRSG